MAYDSIAEAEPVARANADSWHVGCGAAFGASCRRGSSVTFGKYLMIPIHWNSQKPIKNLPALRALHKERGGSIVFYKSVMSAVFFSTMQSNATWVAPYKSRKVRGIVASIPTLLLGWWSVTGLFWTISSLVYNFSGGCDITPLVTEPLLIQGSDKEKEEIVKIQAWEKMIQKRFLYVLCVLLVGIVVSVWTAVA